MFHTIITLAYIIPNIYVFLRVWKLFISKGNKLYYTLIYFFFALIYPVSNLFPEESLGFLPVLFSIISNYLLAFYLYLFLSVLVIDILLLLNWLLKIIPSEKLRSTHTRITGLFVIIFFSLTVVIAGIINFNTIRISEYKIEIPAKSSGIKNLKIAFVADFHLQEGTNIHFVERFTKNISDIKPDLMLFGGDIVEGDRQDENMAVFEKLISDIKTKYGVFTVLGNHEYYAGQDKGSFFDKAGMKVLCDTVIVIDSSFVLSGRNDSHFRTRKTINQLMKSIPDSLPVILIDHRPTEIDEVSKTTVDVQLSGHTHDGQMFPINLITRKVYELSQGYRKIRNTHFFVTSGIRLWGPPVRTSGKSEIIVLHINFSGI
jgi:predicted MPP superfamily phosphohydrolase